MSFRVSSHAKDTLEVLKHSVEKNSELLQRVVQMVEPIGSRLELIDRIAQQTQLLEQLGPRLELIDRIAQQTQLLEQLGPRLELIDDLHNRLKDVIDLSSASKAVLEGLRDIQSVFDVASGVVANYMDQNHLVSESVRIDVEAIQALVTSLQVQLNQMQSRFQNAAS
jgi:hypothetical protein